ncbi:MAG TPA: hypothetical protein VL400_06160 [Polyangiaceae bacterium]|nr:hypothetical protein [Polyangiaceae bacterium]
MPGNPCYPPPPTGEPDRRTPPKFRALALFRYDAPKAPLLGSWTRVEIDGAPRPLPCNATAPLAELLGLKGALPEATYWIVASLDGAEERSLVFAGANICNDVDIGPAPDGEVATCVIGPKSSVAMFVQDPAALKP